MADALVATEDATFFRNHGIAVNGLLPGAYGTVTGAADAGGATIEQRLAKTLYTGGRSGPVQVAEQLALAVKLDVHSTRRTSSVRFTPGRAGW